MKHSILALTTLAFFALSSTAALAIDNDTTSSTFPKPMRAVGKSELKPHVGLLLGAAQPEGRQTAQADYGIDVGFQPWVPYGVGLEVAGTRVNDDDRARVLVRGTYNFGGEQYLLQHSYIGAAVGAQLGSVGDSDRALAAFAPMIGFDIPVASLAQDRGDFVSLGLHAKYLITEGSDPDSGSLNGVVKYWF